MRTPCRQSRSGKIGSSGRKGVHPESGSAKPYRPVHQLRRVGRVVRFSGKWKSKTTPSAARRSRCGVSIQPLPYGPRKPRWRPLQAMTTIFMAAQSIARSFFRRCTTRQTSRTPSNVKLEPSRINSPARAS